MPYRSRGWSPQPLLMLNYGAQGGKELAGTMGENIGEANRSIIHPATTSSTCTQGIVGNLP